jgi:hypothetical protein
MRKRSPANIINSDRDPNRNSFSFVNQARLTTKIAEVLAFDRRVKDVEKNAEFFLFRPIKSYTN